MNADKRFFRIAVTFELSLAGLAVLVGWLVGIAPPLESLTSSRSVASLVGQIAMGVVATMPLLVGLIVLERLTWKSVVEVRRFLGEQLIPCLRSLSIVELAFISACAGIGEETLFRGLLQTWMTPLAAGLAIVISSLLFGLMHSITKAYVVLAFVAGLYFGWIWYASQQILVPIVAHSLYDFVALVWIVRYRAHAYLNAEYSH